jgi:hypothetical protein
MSPARKRATKGAKKTTKKASRKAPAKKVPKAGAKKKAAKASAKTTATRKTPRKAAKKTTKRATKPAKKRTAEPRPSQTPPKPSPAKGGRQRAAATTRRAKQARRQPKQEVAQPLESAERKPGLGAKWACFSCGAKFYDLNRPDPICPKCQTDQRDQPARAVVAPAPPAAKRPAAAPISRLLDEEDGSETVFEEDGDAEAAAELDIGKFDDGDDYLDEGEFSDDSED